jgi:HPt (histidine-containing phosphotransfer) domain-containing protein
MYAMQDGDEYFRSTKDVESDTPVIDLGYLQRVTLGDSALQNEVLGLFREQIASSVSALRKSIADDDCASWRMAAHTLKGSARAVGAFRLAQEAERAERDNETLNSRARGAERIAIVAVATVAAIG